MAPSKLHSPTLRANLTAGCQSIGACHTPGPKYSCALTPLASLLHESHGSGSGGTHRTVACWRADHRRRGHLTQRVWARALEPSGSKALLNELPVRSNAASTVDTIELESLEPPGSTGPLREAWARKRTLRKCLLEAGLTAGPVEQLLASTRHVGDHAEARLDFWRREGPAAGGAEGAAAAALVGNPWLLTCDYHEMLAIRSCLLHHGVSLRHNTKILRYALTHGSANVEAILGLLDHLGLPDSTPLLHAYPRLLALRWEDLSSKLAYLRSLGLSDARLCHLFRVKPQFIYPSLATMQCKVAFLLGAGFTLEQVAHIISRYPLALGSNLSGHFSHVQNLFQEFGFSDADFLYVVERFPAVLLCRAEGNLRPKLRYFRSLGLSRPQLVAMVKAYPCLLAKNLHSAIKPKVEFLLGSMERDVSELVAYAAVLGYSMARLRRRQAAVSQYGITCSLSTLLSRTDRQFEQYVQRCSRQTYEAKMAGVRHIHQRQHSGRPSALDCVEVADFELPVYKLRSGGQLKWPTR